MSKLQRGRNSGLTGLIDVPGFDAKFNVRVYGWKPNMTGTVRQRRGRGGGKYRTTRWIMSSGNVACKGQTRLDGWPAPDKWEGQTGTLTFTIGTGKTIAYPVMVQQMGFNLDEKTEDIPDVTLSCEVTGNPVYTGWGTGDEGDTQPEATGPDESDQQQWEDTSFTKDPHGLQGASTVVIDWWGTVTDSDAGDTGKLDDVIGAVVAPYTGLKLRTAALARDADDGGTVTLSFGLTSTADDVVNEASSFRIDPNKMQTAGTVAAINSDPALPTVSGQTIVDRGTTNKTLNDGNTLYTKEGGQRSTQDDVTMEGTQAKIDLAGIASTGQDTNVFAATDSEPDDASSPDASLKVVGRLIQDINRDEKKKITYFEPNDEIEKLIFGRARKTTDGFALKSTKVIGAVYTTGSEPSPPGASGLVLIDKEAMTVISPDTSNLSVTFWQYGEVTSADAEIFPRTETITDPHDIRTTQKGAALFTTGSPPDDPSLPTGLKLVDTADSPMTNASASNQSIRVYRWGKLDSRDEIGLPKWKTQIDANSIEDDGVRYKFYLTTDTAPTVPDDPPTNNTKIIAKYDVKPTPANGMTAGTMLRVFLYGAKDSRDELVLPNTETTTDASGLGSIAIVAGLDGDTISVPSTFFLRDTKTRPVTLGLGTNRTLTVKICGLRTHAEDIERPGTSASADNEGTLSISARLTMQTTVGTCTGSDTASSLLATLVAALNGSTSVPWSKAEITLEHSTRYIEKIWRPADDKKVTIRSSGGRFEERMLDQTGTYINVPDAYIKGSGQLYIRLQPFTYWVTRETLVLRRYKRADNEADISHEELIGTRDNSGFLGKPATTCAYVGHEIAFNWNDDGGNVWLAVDYVFERVLTNFSGTIYDVNWSDSAIPRPGWYTTTASITVPGTPAASTTDATWVVRTLINSTGYAAAFL